MVFFDDKQEFDFVMQACPSIDEWQVSVKNLAVKVIHISDLLNSNINSGHNIILSRDGADHKNNSSNPTLQ